MGRSPQKRKVADYTKILQWHFMTIGCLVFGGVASDAADHMKPRDAASVPPMELTLAIPRPSGARAISGSETVLPISVEADAIIVHVMVNGRGPLPMLLDT